MGDQLIVNGLVRKMYLDKQANMFNLIVKESTLKNMEILYSDMLIDHKFKFQVVKDDFEAEKVFNHFKGTVLKFNLTEESFDYTQDFAEDLIYKKAGYDPKIRYDFPFMIRDQENEDKVYHKLVTQRIGEEPYIFVADDSNRGYTIQTYKAGDKRTGQHILRASDFNDYTLFDLFKVLVNADEVHCMYSAFLMFIDTFILNENIYIHESYFKKIGPVFYSKPFRDHWEKRGAKFV
jgi:hypothetical protein